MVEKDLAAMQKNRISALSAQSGRTKRRNIPVTPAQSAPIEQPVAKHLFLLSFHDRDPLAAELSGLGWRVSSARRGDELHNRIASSRALIAVIDVRNAEAEGQAAIAEVHAIDPRGGLAILALGDAGRQSDIAAKCYTAGATHFLDLGNDNADLAQALKFANRYAENMRGGRNATDQLQQLLARSDEAWSFRKSDLNDVMFSDQMRLGLGPDQISRYPVTGFYRNMTDKDRARVRGAMGRLRSGSAQAAIPHHWNGEKVIHHLHDAGDRLHGRIERLSSDPAAENWMERDLLSGLRNGAAARTWIRDGMERGREIGFVAMGLKNFETINAAYGRSVGDEVMRRIGQRLIATTSEHSSDNILVARMDGQNFVVALNLGEGVTDAPVFADGLLNKVFDPVSIDGRKIRLTARAGVASGQGPGDETSLVRRGILALAESMASDSVTIKVSASTDKDVMLEQQLEGELAHALERNEITISFQPQIRTDTGQLIGAEALARWNHPKFGFLGAGTLFAVADRAGLMELLSSHIHNRALELAAQWPESLSFLRLSINVTAGDLASRRFVGNISDAIGKSGFSSDRVTLEITESELISDLDSAADRLKELRELGLRVAIDDFGTGYSSLAYLKNLPLDYLKIDSGLTGDISGSEKDQVVVRSIISMAHSLGLSVIAEGVETEEQLALLSEQGCEFYQGFLRSGPLVPDEFEIFALRSD